MLRTTKLTVRDEIKNGWNITAYLPQRNSEIYAGLENHLEALFGKNTRVSPLLRVGSWIGGDRDGNPFVTHDVMLDALQQHSTLVFEHYLEETRVMGGRLSLTDAWWRSAMNCASFPMLRRTSRGAQRRTLPPCVNAGSFAAFGNRQKAGLEISHLPPADKNAVPYAAPQDFIGILMY